MDNAALIDQYEAGPAECDALAGITDDELDRRPEPGAGPRGGRPPPGRQRDHELHPPRRMLAIDGAEIQSYDEAAWAAEPRLAYDGPIEPPLAVLEAVRAATTGVLRRLDDADFARPGFHPEHDNYSVQIWLEIYAEHAHIHADQIRRAGRACPEAA